MYYSIFMCEENAVIKGNKTPLQLTLGLMSVALSAAQTFY